MWLQTVLPLLALLSSCAAYRFLVVFPLPARSHGILGKGIVRSLLEAGHEVTYITAFPEENPQKGLQQVDVSFMSEGFHSAMPNIFNHEAHMSFTQVKQFAFNNTIKFISNQAIQDFLKDESRGFDAAITEWFFSDVYVGFSQVFQCPWILVTPMGMSSNMEYLIDEVQSPASNPFILLGYTVPMTLKERMINSFITIYGLLQTIYMDHPKEALIYDEYFGPAARARGIQLTEYSQVVHNVALLLINSHHSLGQAQRLPPNAVEIGGYHIDQETKPLPKDLQQLLDEAPHGVIYFSMGSNLKSADMPEEMRRELLRVFGRLRETVLWKFEADMKDAPGNVHIRPWMPQQSILAHKNVKIFITHGGLLSTTESIHFGVPTVVIPVFGDQFTNAMRAERKGYALSVDLKGENFAKDLEQALKKMLADPSYRNTVRHLSQLFHDRPVPPAKLVSYWVEHVVRTNGGFHLRTAASSVPAYQRYLLDIIAIIVAALLVVLWLLRALLRLALNKLFSTNDSSAALSGSAAGGKKKKRS